MEIQDHDALMKELIEQEKQLQFSEFTSETAMKIGLALADRAKREGRSIVIDITRHGHELFHYAMEGTTPDNEAWVAGKNRLVNRFNHSSLYLATVVRKSGRTVEEVFRVSAADHRVVGGSFPIIIKNVGVIGTIAVSGMPDHMDHAFIVDGIRSHLGQ